MPTQAHIKYQGKGFWIPESFIEILSHFICETMESNGVNNYSSHLQKVYDDCKWNRSGHQRGMVDIALDEYIIDDDYKKDLINVLNQTKTLILSKGTELSTAMLNDLENKKTSDYLKHNWAFPIKTTSLNSTIDIIIQMLNGIWQSNNYGVYYSGWPKPTWAPEI